MQYLAFFVVLVVEKETTTDDTNVFASEYENIIVTSGEDFNIYIWKISNDTR